MVAESDPPYTLITDVPFGTCEAGSCWGKEAGAKTYVTLRGTCFTVCHCGLQRRRWRNYNKVDFL